MKGHVAVGVVPPFAALASSAPERRRVVQAVADNQLDHLAVVDHVSFHGGQGYDALVHAAAALSMHDTLPVYVGVYLLGLRHPVLVARQLASLAELAPGRLTLGVGLGGEDRAEVRMCGVDPATRGRRTDECLAVLRLLATGSPVTFTGEHVQLQDTLVLPVPSPPVPLVVGGRSAAALRRAATLGDGWLGLWVSPERFEAAVQQVAQLASAAGRTDPPTRHGLTVWCGFGRDAAEGEKHLAPDMEATYRQPFSTFRRWSPCGTPAQVAAALQPYLSAGCGTLNLIARGADLAATLAGAGEVRRLLVT